MVRTYSYVMAILLLTLAVFGFIAPTYISSPSTIDVAIGGTSIILYPVALYYLIKRAIWGK